MICVNTRFCSLVVEWSLLQHSIPVNSRRRHYEARHYVLVGSVFTSPTSGPELDLHQERFVLYMCQQSIYENYSRQECVRQLGEALTHQRRGDSTKCEFRIPRNANSAFHETWNSTKRGIPRQNRLQESVDSESQLLTKVEGQRTLTLCEYSYYCVESS